MKQLTILPLLCLLCLLCGCSAEENSSAMQEPAQQEVSLPAQESVATGYVALTFDDGPTPKHTARLLDGLKERGIHATFFLVGYRLQDNAALVQRIKAEGHQIGNHSYDHAQLTTLSHTAALEDLADCDLALCTLLGEGDYWVRPPYGTIHPQTQAALDVPVICWSVDPLDWAGTNAEIIAEHIVQNAADGDIILLHDCYADTVDAALAAADQLLARGLQLVTVEQLLTLYGKEVQGGHIFYSGK